MNTELWLDVIRKAKFESRSDHMVKASRTNISKPQDTLCGYMSYRFGDVKVFITYYYYSASVESGTYKDTFDYNVDIIGDSFLKRFRGWEWVEQNLERPKEYIHEEVMRRKCLEYIKAKQDDLPVISCGDTCDEDLIKLALIIN